MAIIEALLPLWVGGFFVASLVALIFMQKSRMLSEELEDVKSQRDELL